MVLFARVLQMIGGGRGRGHGAAGGGGQGRQGGAARADRGAEPAGRLRQHAEERLHHDQEHPPPHRQRRLPRRPADHPRARRDLFVHASHAPDELVRRLGRRSSSSPSCAIRCARAYSCFNEKVHFRARYSFGGVRRHVAAAYGAEFVEQPTLELHRANFKAFLRFAHDSFAGENGWRRDAHWCPQSMVLNQVRRWRMVDFIGRVEQSRRPAQGGAGAGRRSPTTSRRRG